MKTSLIVIFLFTSVAVFGQNYGVGLSGKAAPFDYTTYSNSISDGWYKASVGYYNYNTFTSANYALLVKVVNDKVKVVDFGNGGYVHDGYNESGYTYWGGNLNVYTDIYGAPISATTTVTIYEEDGNRMELKINIE